MLDDFELEKIEKLNFDVIKFHLIQDLNSLIIGLNSRMKIINDWYDNFIRTKKGYKASDLDTGAERIFHHFFANILHFPNSSPIGSDLMFELPESFIHIEVKTALIDNPSDYKGKVNIAINQTSYGLEGKFSPNLPFYYQTSSDNEKPCLTYIIQIIHEHAKPDIKSIKLVCIPNGQLFSYYGEDIIGGGKTKGTSFRYMYSREPHFKLLSEKYKEDIFRVELIYLSRELKVKDITSLSSIPVHFQY